MKAAELDIVIINRNTPGLTRDCVRSVLNTSHGLRVNIIIADNASTDGSADVLEEEFPDCTILRFEDNLGYGAAFNRAFCISFSPLIIISNSDVIYHEDSLQHIVAYMTQHPETAVCGVQQVFADGSWQRSYGLVPGILPSLADLFGLTFVHRRFIKRQWKDGSTSTKARSVSYIDGAVMCFRREALAQVGGFDEYFFFFVEDADICFTLSRKGWKIVMLPNAVVTHLRGGTRSTSIEEDMRYLGNNIRARFQFIRKHFGMTRSRIVAILQSLYYAELLLIHTCASWLTNGVKKANHRNKVRICEHIIRVCADELEQENGI